MNKIKLSALLLGFLLIGGCSEQGDRIPGKCGVSESNPNLVVAYNNEQCQESVSKNFLSILLKGEGKATIPKNDEAYTAVQENIDNSPTKLKLQQQANTSTSIAKFGWVTAVWFIAVFILIFNVIRILLSKGSQEKDMYETAKPRYRGWSYVMPFVGIFFMFPYYYEGDDSNRYSTISAYLPILKIMWGDSLEASFASVFLANEQKGDIGSVTTESTKKYDPGYANARMIAYAQVNAQLLDNVTAKHYYKLNNLLLPQSERQVEFQEPLKVFFDGNSVSIRRLEIGSLRQDQTISEVATMNIKETYSLNPSVKSDASALKNQYATKDSGQQQTMLEGFKQALMKSVGVEKPNADINNAVTAQSNENVRNILINEMLTQTLIRQTARLNEELKCIEEKQVAGETYIQDIKGYLKFLKGEIPKSQFEGAIECVGGTNGAFKIYGERDIATATNERNTAFKQLVDSNYKIVGGQADALAKVTIDASNGSACVKARKGLGTDFSRYYPVCKKESSANKQIINMAVSNFSMTGNGEGSYVDTNYALKNNSQSDSMMMRDFDIIMSDMLNSVEVKVEFRETNKDAYLEALITGNLGDVNSLQDTIMFIIRPDTSFKRDLGWTEECKGSLYRCIKSDNVIPALSNVSEKMIDTGFYIATFSLTASMLASKFNKADDKSMSLDGKTKKNKSLKNKLLKFAEFLFSMFSTYGWWMLYIGWLIAYILAVIPLFFVIVGLLILILLFFSILASIFRFVWMLWPNDNNNIKMNLRKMANEFIYDVSIKSVLIIIQVFFYVALGWALKNLCFLMLLFMQQGTTEAIFGSLLLAPMLYFVIISMLQGTIRLLDAYAERLGGNSMLAEIMSDSLQLCLIVVTMGLPLLFIKIHKAVRRR
ncbi:hypothetical protein [Pseudomonas carnis]|uniref:hypothetical protein n=1 Tax=Pseudomonas carnis TaxID=2487355 RepID=UPI001E5523D7|nr:hypothetical protein [Pseudomonas carnis]